MLTVTAQTVGDRHPARCIDMVIASVESFSGGPRPEDRLMLLSRPRQGASRFGQAVFLREEIDAGSIHGLFKIPPGGLAPLLTKLAGKSAVSLEVNDGFWLSGIPARLDAGEGGCLIALDPAAVEDLTSRAGVQGLTLSPVGDFRPRPDVAEARKPPLSTDTVQAAFWARRRFWRQSLQA